MTKERLFLGDGIGMAADEVVQLYVTDHEASGPVPRRALKGFQRISLAPGEARVVRFTLDERAFSLIGADGRRVVEPGRFTISVGGKQPGLGGTADAATTVVLTADVDLTGAVKVEGLWDTTLAADARGVSILIGGARQPVEVLADGDCGLFRGNAVHDHVVKRLLAAGAERGTDVALPVGVPASSRATFPRATAISAFRSG